MYSEHDIHTECIVDPLVDHNVALEPNENVHLSTVLNAEHPKSIITLTCHDGRKFKTTITTEEIDA